MGGVERVCAAGAGLHEFTGTVVFVRRHYPGVKRFCLSVSHSSGRLCHLVCRPTSQSGCNAGALTSASHRRLSSKKIPLLNGLDDFMQGQHFGRGRTFTLTEEARTVPCKTWAL